MTRFALLATVLVLGLAGCGDPSAVEPAPASTAAVEDAAPRVVEVPAEIPEVAPAVAAVAAEPEPVVEPGTEPLLVWGVDVDGGTYSWWLEPDELGGWDVVEAEGIYVADGDGLWMWTTEEEPLPLGMDCDLFDSGDQPPYDDTGRTGTGVRAELVRIGGEGEQSVVEPLRDQAFASADWGESVALEGSIGPLLFVHRSGWGYSCGAHGGEMHEFLVYDASTGAPTSLYDADAAVALADRLRPEAWAALSDQMPFADGPQELSVTVHRPVFGADGALGLEHQLTASTCYACGDGAWDSYTTSAQVRDDVLPEAIVPFADYPAEAVRWLGEQVEGLDVRGVSRPSPALRPAFEERQVPGC